MASNGNGVEDGGEIRGKKRIVTERLQKRNVERQAEVQKRLEEKSQTDAARESKKSFEGNFNREKAVIEAEISRSEQIEKVSLVEHFDSISTKLSKLQKYVAESTMFLPAHDLSKAQLTIAKLQMDIQEKRDVLIPKKKFAFKSKRSEKPKQIKPEVEEVDHVDKQKSNLEVELADCKFVSENGSTLEKSGDELCQKDVALADLTDCVVKLHGAPSAIHINKLKNCKIFSGPVSGSVFIRECEGCTFLLPCQQLRIHTTHNSDFYIHVTSKAIIEDCMETHFAPYNWTYPCIDDHYKMSGLDKSRNNWDDVDDFNWLAADVHSPNWSVIAEENRQKNWDI